MSEQEGCAKLRIVIRGRSGDIQAYVPGDGYRAESGQWAAGKSVYEAIGDLVLHHAESLGIELDIDEPSVYTAMQEIRYKEGRQVAK